MDPASDLGQGPSPTGLACAENLPEPVLFFGRETRGGVDLDQDVASGGELLQRLRLLLLAERSWRRLDGHELLPLVRAGVSFKDGGRVEREADPETVLAKKRLSATKGKRRKGAA